MVDIQNWDAIPDAVEYDKPTPGGYVGVICDYQDVDQINQNGKGLYLKLFWDFADGPFRGSINEAYLRLGYWFNYGTFIRSYRSEQALTHFKAFKTCLEVSNPRYMFSTSNLDGMKGKRLGIVLGEEEYQKQDGSVGKRLYVAATRSVKAIQTGDFKVPPLKKLDSCTAPAAATAYTQPLTQQGFSYGGGFVPVPDESDIPF